MKASKKNDKSIDKMIEPARPEFDKRVYRHILQHPGCTPLQVMDAITKEEPLFLPFCLSELPRMKNEDVVVYKKIKDADEASEFYENHVIRDGKFVADGSKVVASVERINKRSSTEGGPFISVVPTCTFTALTGADPEHTKAFGVFTEGEEQQSGYTSFAGAAAHEQR